MFPRRMIGFMLRLLHSGFRWGCFSLPAGALFLLLGSPWALGAESGFELHVNNDFSVQYNNITGPGSANSMLTEGVNYLEVLAIDGFGKSDDLAYDFHIVGQMTDDPNYDVRKQSLTNFSLNLTTPHQALSLGDSFQAFSQYSLTTALKGGAYSYLGGPRAWQPRVTLLWGMAAPRWDSIWGGRDTRTMERQVYGARVSFESRVDLAIGLNVVGLNDAEPIETFERVYDDTMIYSLDFNYRPIPGLMVYGEGAFNKSKIDAGQATATERIEGYAVKIRAVGDEDPSRVSIEYERIDPEFDNPVGSVTPDREKVKFMWRYKLTGDVHLNTNMLWFRNNLDHQDIDPRTDTYRPEIGLTVLRPFGRRYAATRLTYNKKIARRDGDTIKNDDLIYLNYRDRFGVLDMDTNLGYSMYRNQSDAALDNGEILYNTVIRTRFSAGLFVVKPAVYLGGWNFRDELADSDDRFYEYSLGLGVDVPNANITSNFKAGRNRLKKDTGEDSEKSFATAAIFWRPAFPAFMDRSMIFLQGFIDDFDFSDDGDDFREDSITAGISISI